MAKSAIASEACFFVEINNILPLFIKIKYPQTEVYSLEFEESKKAADIEISNCEIGLRSKNKGGLFQYLRYFPNDQNLNYWDWQNQSVSASADNVDHITYEYGPVIGNTNITGYFFSVLSNSYKRKNRMT